MKFSGDEPIGQSGGVLPLAPNMGTLEIKARFGSTLHQNAGL